MTEQSVPELGPGPIVEADVRAEGGPSDPIRYADVVVTHPVQVRYGRITATGPGVAAAREERGKVAHHKAREGGREVLLVPLAFETYGRWGASAALELKRLARRRSEMLDARCSVDASSVYKGCLRKWRQELAVALQMSNWAIWAAAAHGLRTDAVSHSAPDGPVATAELIMYAP